jgi:hypothetical protein
VSGPLEDAKEFATVDGADEARSKINAASGAYFYVTDADVFEEYV